jgi:hypothetical protein
MTLERQTRIAAIIVLIASFLIVSAAGYLIGGV